MSRAELALALLLVAACAERAPIASPEFEAAATCEGCHPDHAREWRGSVMHYAARSPVFNALELAVRERSGGAFAAGGEHPNFCSRCHAPTAHYAGELPRDTKTAVADTLSDVSRDGVSCDFCHTVVGSDVEGSIAGDGLANLALEFGPDETKRGNFDGAHEAAPHGAMRSDFLRSSEFCGACHDVRLPQPDTATGEPFMRVENLFTEWAGSSYAFATDRDGDAISCQDCHMSLYPLGPPGAYPQAIVGAGGDEPRRHAMHAFTAVSAPLIDDPDFPNVDTDEVDRFGYPVGQEQRRTLMLRAACRVSINVPEAIRPDAEQLRAVVTVTNVGAGHNVPSGFSEERQVWLHVVVRDENGLLYESGYLVDRPHPETGETEADGILHDEPLENVHRTIDPATLEEHAVPGADTDLVNFQNAFLRFDEHGVAHEVLDPLAADTVDDDRALRPNVPRSSLYEIPIDRRLEGEIQISVVLRYRSFPPELMRALAVRYPHLLSEDTVDRNRIVDMAEASAVVRLE